jgi:hypothetical protein
MVAHTEPTTHACVSLPQVVFEVVNVMICLWEIALFTYAKEVQREYREFREK